MKAADVGLKQIPTTKSHAHIPALWKMTETLKKTWHKGADTNITRALMGHIKNKKSPPRCLKDKTINLSM